ncbi:diacylglycerol O-acyltransferase [Powellomyces hirtus]|uniref:O-acyltransferase n=1 Tax=Powellomyces hirtus TaxID=109895 RepID=A0A507EB68_9FUNG|nr:diacylglycerol O-acyltransferase [Powellomyces hirtus]
MATTDQEVRRRQKEVEKIKKMETSPNSTSASYASDDRSISSKTTVVEPSKAVPEVTTTKAVRYSHTYVVHTTIRASPLSKESPEQNYRGFFNLSMLLLAVSNTRLIVENYMKYGFILSLPFSGHERMNLHLKWAFFSFVWQASTVVFAFFIEKLSVKSFQRNVPNDFRIKMLHAVNTSLMITVPTAICWNILSNPVISALTLFGATTLMLKTISYALVNADLRREVLSPNSPNQRCEEPSSTDASLDVDAAFDIDRTPYPTNITFSNLAYFIFAPTLCYQPSFPRTTRFRKTFFAKRLLEFSVGIAAMYLLGGQYAAPTLRNSLAALDNLDFVHLFERVLKLSVVSVVIWLLMFYSFFHCALNMLAEIMRFGDRRFYLQWWNAKDIAEYWRLWNTPVHNWGKRHIYMPLIVTYKVSPTVASIGVFTISALLHELLIGVPTRCLNGWAFAGMMLQLPMILQSRALIPLRAKNEKLFDTVGNYVFWLSFTIVGQPAAVLVYYSHWYKRNSL